jgi:hypothetical protein
MQRYNIFSQVHKGLRAMLYHTANKLQQTDFSDAAEGDLVMKQVIEIMDLFDRHAFTEDSFILPAIEQHEPGVASLFENEHVEDHGLSNRLRSLVHMFNHTFSPLEKNILGGSIRFAFVQFLIFNLEHMGKEEDVLNNLLWAHYADEELHGITREILAHIAPEDMARYSRWMIKGLSNSEIIAWLKEVRNTAPGFVFTNLFTMAEAELPEQRWLKVKDSLVDGAMVA